LASSSAARAAHHKHTLQWGYRWALWAAILWGAWYVPGTAVWHESPFASLNLSDPHVFLVCAAVITAFNSALVMLFQWVWLAALGKLGDYFRTMGQFRKISRWYFIAAIAGGLMANFGSYLAMGYVGAVFAAVAGLLYPVVGATVAKLWYNERISARAAVGILIIIGGGVAIYAPALMTESHTSSHQWIGYLGGAMAAIGWGLEGAIVGRAMDVTDPDCGVSIRYTAEAIFWVIFVLPAIALFAHVPVPVMDIVSGVAHSKALLWLAAGGLTFAFCAVAWYKSFPLIGVGRGQALGAFYAMFATLFTALFTLQFPQWYFLIGLALVIFGGFVMVSESSENMEVIRGATPAATTTETPA
jgi:drug/metabolite transporter (DMT)-like permease